MSKFGPGDKIYRVEEVKSSPIMDSGEIAGVSEHQGGGTYDIQFRNDGRLTGDLDDTESRYRTTKTEALDAFLQEIEKEISLSVRETNRLRGVKAQAETMKDEAAKETPSTEEP